MGGPPPKPSVIRDLEGDCGNRPRNKNEPKPTGVLREPPTHFSKSQKRLWENALAAAPPGLLTRLDWSILAVWVVAADMHAKATRTLEREGVTYRSKAGAVTASPFVFIQSRQAEIMMRSATMLGFTPTSRPKIEVPLPAPPPSEPEPQKNTKQESMGRGLWHERTGSDGSLKH